MQKIEFANLSLGSVSRELGVTTTAMYRLFPSRNHMIDFCIQYAFSSDLPLANPANLIDLLRNICWKFWEIFEQFPGLSTMVQKHPLSPQFYVSILGDIISSLELSGISRQHTLTLIRHVPVIMSTHHAVYEAQRRDANDSGAQNKDLAKLWLDPIREDAEFESKDIDPELLLAVGKCLILDWNSAWACVEDILRLINFDTAAALSDEGTVS
ncbi:hypothetical protein QVA66_10430 [Staphylococcus chromogenes]|nr:hypothetical protein [Staphylococcus chromogenes]